MSTGIYKIENLINGKIYIGQSIHIEKRWQEHCKASSHSLIAEAIQKYGKENFSFQIIEECEQDLLNTKESEYIHSYNSLVPNGYNIVLTTEGKCEVFNKYTPETLLNIYNDIQNEAMSFREIAEKYDLDLSMIYYLNRGDYHYNSNYEYPLRQVKDFSKKIYKCCDCGIQIGKGALRCANCDHKRQYRCEHPSREELKSLIRTHSFLAISKMYGVTDNAIRKWCKGYNLPSKSKDIKSYSDSDWEKI